MCSNPRSFIMMCLLGAAAVYSSEEDECACPCPQPPPWNLTKTPEADDCCRHSSRFRYECVDGYVRKAGSSNLVWCKVTARGPRWSDPKLSCIPDPNKPQVPMRTTTDESTETPQASSFITSTSESPTTRSPHVWTSGPTERHSPLPTTAASPLSSAHAQTKAAHTQRTSAPRQMTSTPTTPPSVSTGRDGPRPTIIPQIKTLFQTLPPTRGPTTRSPHVWTSGPTERHSPLPSAPLPTTAASPLSSAHAQTKVAPVTTAEGTDPTFGMSASGSSSFSPTEMVPFDSRSGSRGADAVGPAVGGILPVVFIALLLIGFRLWQRNKSRSADPHSTVEEQVAMVTPAMTDAPPGPAAP